MKIEEILGLSDDLQRAWMQGMTWHAYVGGLSKDWAADAKATKVKEMRENFVETELPSTARSSRLISRRRRPSSPGRRPRSPTASSCAQLAYFTRCAADPRATTVLDGWPEIKKYLARMLSLPAVKDWYGL